MKAVAPDGSSSDASGNVVFNVHDRRWMVLYNFEVDGGDGCYVKNSTIEYRGTPTETRTMA